VATDIIGASGRAMRQALVAGTHDVREGPLGLLGYHVPVTQPVRDWPAAAASTASKTLPPSSKGNSTIWRIRPP
jgi:hypothetical protein